MTETDKKERERIYKMFGVAISEFAKRANEVFDSLVKALDKIPFPTPATESIKIGLGDKMNKENTNALGE
jgi:hypothetical protein